MIKYPSHLIVLISIYLLLTGCKPIHVNRSQEKILDNSCQPSERIFYYDSLLEGDAIYLTEPDSLTQQRFTQKALDLASVIGITDLLNHYTQLEKEVALKDDRNSKLELLFVRQELDEKLTLSLLDISTTLAEIDCEQHKASEVRDILRDRINKQVKALTILSIVAGAAGTFASGGISIVKPDANNLIQTVSILGAVAAGYWGLQQLFVDKKIQFYHQRNYLSEIWNKPYQSKIIHPNIWFFITKDTVSKRDKIISQFYENGILSKKKTSKQEKMISVFFSQGGEYNVDMLTDRINMLELLETQINMMKYDLKLLQQEILINK